jgi:hypothetical protein
MQNEPNFQKSQMNVKPFMTMDYENKHDWTLGENEPKTNPILPAVALAKAGSTPYPERDYENKHNWTLGENKPKTNPIQTQSKPKQSQFKPNLSRRSLWRSRIKPNFTPIASTPASTFCWSYGQNYVL